MKQLIIFLVVTIVAITLSDFYFEYCISKDYFEKYAITLFGLAYVIGLILYFKYAINLLINLLTPKQNDINNNHSSESTNQPGAPSENKK